MVNRILTPYILQFLLLFTLCFVSCNEPPYYQNIKNELSAIVRIVSIDRMGSGVIISKNGYLLTSRHVIGNHENVAVTMMDGTTLEGKTVMSEERYDIALLKLSERDAEYVFASTGNSNECDDLQIGSPVLVASYPVSGNDNKKLNISSGIICAFRRIQSVDYIQSDATVYPGSSGGPMFNDRGQVIGIVNSRYNMPENTCATFATAIDNIKELIDRIKAGALPLTLEFPGSSDNFIMENETIKTAEIGENLTNLKTDRITCARVGCYAPVFNLSTIDSIPVTLESYHGKKLIMVFTTTRCSSCFEVMRCIQQIYDSWPRTQMDVLVVVSQEKPPEVEKWIKLYGIKVQVALDPDGKIINLYQPSKLPAIYFLDSEGIIKIKKYAPLGGCGREIDALLRLY